MWDTMAWSERVDRSRPVALLLIRLTQVEIVPDPIPCNALLVSATGVSIALWVGLTGRKHTNQLMAADQRKQASQIRVSVPKPTVADPHILAPN